MSKTTTKTYLFHELSSIFPLMEGDDFNALIEDMREKGQLKKGVLFEEKILDGRNRYRVCKILKIPFKTEEYSEKISPRDYIISENLHRRHLTIAQRAEIGLILLQEEEDKAKERMQKIRSEVGKVIGRGREKSELGETKKKDLAEKIDKIKEELGEGISTRKVAPKVKISSFTLQKAKKIKEVAKKDKFIAEKWEDAKRGKSTVDAVYKEVKKKETIEDLKDKSPAVVKELKEEKPVITIREAKIIAEIPSEDLIKQEIAERKLAKERQEKAIKKKKDLAEGKILPKPKYFDKDASKVKAIEDICKKAVDGLTFAGLEGYGKVARDACIKMMKILFEHLREELKKAGEVAPRKVIDTDAY